MAESKQCRRTSGRHSAEPRQSPGRDRGGFRAAGLSAARRHNSHTPPHQTKTTPELPAETCIPSGNLGFLQWLQHRHW